MEHCSRLPLFLLSLLLLSLFQTPANAAKQSYIVYLGTHSHGLNPTSVELEAATNSQYNLLGTVLGSNERAQEALFYSYTREINGFAAVLEEEEASQIAKDPSVVSVFPNRKLKLHTTHSWEFMGLEDQNGVPRHGSIWKKAKFGENTIIGNLDTGVWPESPSFSDEGFGPIPSKWRGTCQLDTKDKVRCNRKLIGARYFNKGFLESARLNNATIPPEILVSPRDQEGHGSHTLSTAGGSYVPGANVFGHGNGTAKGGSPKARVAAYKVCWPSFGNTDGGCTNADIMAAFDAAISDGVDVLSLSVGGDSVEFFEDGIAIGSFHAAKHGIVVVCSAGNSGPSQGSVTNVAPWILTVGASTIDREFTSYLSFGKGKHLKGKSLSSRSLPYKKFYPVISGANANAATSLPEDSLLCLNGTLDPKKVKGKILVCLRGQNGRTEKAVVAALAGAVGMVLVNDEQSGDDLMADPYQLPATHLTYTDGKRVFEYLNSTKNPFGHVTPVKTVEGTKPAPFMASFSSRGPSSIEPSILKPDITAPGVDIIAAYTGAPLLTDSDIGKRRPLYITESGTSMSCPHVSGIVGLLKTLYPSWSPAAIKSAILTTARRRDNKRESILDSTKVSATPLDYGAGHVDPNRAANPGLVYDVTTDDYLNFLCARGYNASLLKIFSDKPHKCSNTSSIIADLNYPTIAVPDLQDKPITISRKVKNVGTPGTYVAYVRAPARVSVSVQPSRLKFKSIGEEKEFKVTLKADGKVQNPDYVFGELKWSDGKHTVRSPIAVMRH
ncbi:subtilisin-like protease SBT5.3 [Rosa chinensis]|uniref:subtilisin-like protease SBT5.3 n=1 Tax=Rosa chinensis TaxID=74649 RepID=UPI000D088413|nr:subtilisin-like protease SBT5.3 [Rosa chinensis]